MSVFEPVLVLNSSWTPIHIKLMKDCISDVFSEVAVVIEHSKVDIVDTSSVISTWGMYHNWKSWMEISETSIAQLTAKANAALADGDHDKYKEYNPRVISACKQQIRGPEVIRLLDYNAVPNVEIRLVKRNIFLRDGFTCQYCSKKVTMTSGTIDHVHPKAKGGKNSWTNCITACFPCNVKKGDKTLSQAGMALLSTPVKPKWYPLTTRFLNKAPKSWQYFLPSNTAYAPALAGAR